MGSPKPHAVVLPYPALGHIIPMMQLSRYLAQKGFIITFVNTEHNHLRILQAQQKSGNSLPQEEGLDIRLIGLPDGLAPDDNRTSDIPRLTKAIESMGPLLEQLIAEQENPVTCIISDPIAIEVQTIADKFGISRAGFWAPTIALYHIFYNLQLLVSNGDVPSSGVPTDRSRIITSLPGLPKLYTRDLPWLIGNDMDTEFLFHNMESKMKDLEGCKWILCNSCYDLEKRVIDAIPKDVKIYPVGPLFSYDIVQGIEPKDNRTSIGLWAEQCECLQWLDRQVPSSVIYVSFGSIAIFNKLHLQELALGLEASEQPFLWVVRPDLMDGTAVEFPEGFLDRTQERSMIISWAPQLQVLSHPSVGGFLTHCGWNSTMESIFNGVPMLTWPYFGDQFVDRQYIVDDWRVGLAIEFDENGLVTREHVEKLVRSLMQGEEGREMKSRVVKLRDGVRAGVTEGGSSYNMLDAFIEEMKVRATGHR